MVICMDRGIDYLHMVQLMPLHSKTPIISCLISVQTGFSLFFSRLITDAAGKPSASNIFTLKRKTTTTPVAFVMSRLKQIGFELLLTC